MIFLICLKAFWMFSSCELSIMYFAHFGRVGLLNTTFSSCHVHAMQASLVFTNWFLSICSFIISWFFFSKIKVSHIKAEYVCEISTTVTQISWRMWDSSFLSGDRLLSGNVLFVWFYVPRYLLCFAELCWVPKVFFFFCLPDTFFPTKVPLQIQF